MARDHIEQAGVDPAGELTYEHFFYFDEEAAARRAAEELALDGFDVDTHETGDGFDTWSVIAVRRDSLDDDEFDALIAELERLAGRHGGTYDGWGTPL